MSKEQPKEANQLSIPSGARAWWASLQPDAEAQRKGDRAGLARLRRAATSAEAMAEEATIDLYRRLGCRPEQAGSLLPRVAVIAMVLAHVRKDAEPAADGRRPAAIHAVGRVSSEDQDSAKMTPLRFRRLLACREDDELAHEMRRFVALADRTVAVGDLANSLFYWGARTRARWAFEYYGAGSAAPSSSVQTAA